MDMMPLSKNKFTICVLLGPLRASKVVRVGHGRMSSSAACRCRDRGIERDNRGRLKKLERKGLISNTKIKGLFLPPPKETGYLSSYRTSARRPDAYNPIPRLVVQD